MKAILKNNKIKILIGIIVWLMIVIAFSDKVHVGIIHI